jgi:hypothetical protein
VKSGEVQVNIRAKLLEIFGAFSATQLFLRIELVVYVALGILLSVTALLALGSAALLLWEGMRDWSGTSAIFLIVDRLMFVLMGIENPAYRPRLRPFRYVDSRAISDHRAHRFDPKRSRHYPEVIGSDLGGARAN